jgi:serine phosphatase RsbU (regulator of sigma subunit)/DNA-binding NarL/FixJ family response regulator
MNDSPVFKIAAVSDQSIFLRGLAGCVLSNPGLTLVGEAQNDADAVQLCELTRPDLVLLDLQKMPDHGLNLAQQISAQWPPTRVILFHDSRADIPEQGLLESNSLYYFSRDLEEEELKTALLQVRCELVGPEIQRAAKPKRRASDKNDDGDSLSEALKDVRIPSGRRTDAHLARELIMAGKIQADILPEKEPSVPGWEIAARLEPARETSGDFYDFICLTEHKWGIIVADVTDKGMGAALFMALSNTMIRTYAHQFPTLPAIVMNEVNKRLLADTRGGMFVTTLYGILEPHSGRFVYANAGNPPGFQMCASRGGPCFDTLRRTGMALGVSEEAQWKQKVTKLSAGDYLVLYTDGITEAENPQGQFFGEERLLDAVLAKSGRPAQEVCDALLDAVHRFVGPDAPQDDITLVVIHRKD